MSTHMLTTLPDNLTLKGSSRCFTAQTLPAALKKWHNTKEKVWGRIVITSGSALYEILTEPPQSMQLSPGVDGIIEPQQPHRVTLSNDAQLQVFFYHKGEDLQANTKELS